MNRKRICAYAITILILILFTQPVFADDLYKNIDSTAEKSQNEFFITDRDNYQIDTEKISFFKDPFSVVLNGITNLVFTLQTNLAKVTLSIFSFSLTSNISGMLAEFIEPFIEQMRSTIWEAFAAVLIGIGAFWMLLQYSRRGYAQLLSHAVALVVIVTFTLAFYQYPVELLNGVDSLTTDVSNSVMEGAYSATTGDKGGDVDMEGKTSSLVWNLLVHEPWEILEFGSVKTAKQYEKEILGKSPESDARQDLVNKLAKSDGLFSKSAGYQSGRLGSALILLLFNILIMIVLVAFSVLLIGYQFLILVYLLIGVFVFLLALIPYFGTQLIRQWLMQLAGTACTKILVAFFLSVLLVFMGVIYGFADKYGLLITMFMIIIMIAMVYLYRHKFVELFTGYRSGTMTQPINMASRSIDKDFNALKTIHTLSKTTRLSLPIRNGEKTEDALGSPRASNPGARDSQRIVGEAAARSVGGTQNTPWSDGSTSNAAAAVTDLRGSFERAGESAESMSRYFNMAEEMLEKQYTKSKEQSEAQALASGRGVEYSNFVRRTDSVRQLGAGQFDQRDITSLARIAQMVEQKGGDPKKVILENEQDALKYRRRHRPTSVTDEANQQMRNHVVGDINQGTTPAETSPIRTGLAYFKSNFGEEQGENLYADLSRKYGQQKIDQFQSQETLTYAQVLKQVRFQQHEEGEQRQESMETGQQEPGQPQQQTQPSLQSPSQTKQRPQTQQRPTKPTAESKNLRKEQGREEQ